MPSGPKRRRVNANLRIARFNLPPVKSALVIGRRSPIGPQALEKALHEMMPDSFRRVDVEHEVIESILVNEAHLRRLPQEEVIALIIRNAEGTLDASETLHVELELELEIHEEFEI